MRIYLVDYENVKNINGVGALQNDDLIYIFYSNNANTLTFDTHKEMLSCRAKIEYVCVDVGGKNALDFQLSSYLGYLINKYEKSGATFIIISKDNGFSFLQSFWKKTKNIDVGLHTNLSGQTQIKAKEEKDNSIEKALRQNIQNLKSGDVAEIIKIISQYKTRKSINDNLGKYFKDSKRVGEINKIIKPYLKDKK